MEKMRKTIQFVVLAWLLAGTAVAWAQGSCTFTDENGKTVTWKDCKPPAEDTPPAQAPNAPGTPTDNDTKAAPPAGVPGNDVSPAKAFPFPGETPAAAAPAQPPSATTGASDAPAKKFPFPGESTAPDTTGGSPLQDAGSSGESSSSSSSSSDGGDAGPDTDNDPAAKAAAARHAARGKALERKQTPSQREDEDLSVASFYMNDKDYKGAYMRALDAVSIAADDPDAHLALADAARKLGKLDEAEKHYKLCLSLDPVPKVKKAAQTALKEMSGG